LAAATVIGGGALVGCRQESPAPAPAIENLPAQSFKREWGANLELKDDTVDRVFVKEDLVFVYTKKNYAYGLNRGSGVVRFSDRVTDSRIPMHPPVVLKEHIVIPTNTTLEIYRRDAQKKERSFTPDSAPRTNASGWVGGSRVFFGVDSRGSGRVVAIELVPGQYKPVNQVWDLMAKTGVQISAGPATLSGVVYAAFSDGQVFAVNADNRQSIWPPTSTGPTFQTFGPINADLQVDDFGVYVPSTDSKFYCLDKTQGKEKWKYYAGAPLESTPAITATMVYLPVGGRGVVAIDKVNGPAIREPKWVVKDAVKLVSEDEKYAYFQRKDNIIVAIEKASGEQRFTSKRTDLVAFGTNTKDATIYAATKDGQVLAITPVLKPGGVGELALAE
jgi:outer membrane protein assembly factor BamB